MTATTGAERIRELTADDTIIMPGVFDALSARICAKIGFEVVFISGYSVSAVRLGEPDFGFLTPSEMADTARAVCRVSSAPVIVDADTGYGNALNVKHVLHAAHAAGAAGVFLEDQMWPKKCGHMSGKRVVPAEEHAAKIRAAADVRDAGTDLFVVARTDARQPHGLDEAIKRCLLYKDAGADALFIEAPHSVDEMARIAAELPPPLVANMVERGATPHLSRDELRDLGFSLIVCPLAGLFSAAYAMADVLDELHDKGTTSGVLNRVMGFDEFNELVGLDAWYAEEDRYRTD